MKRILLLVVVSGLSNLVFGQTETFDIATYTPPKDWKKDAKEGVVNFTNVNANSGGFCVITLYASTTSTGDVKKDFSKSWKDLVVTPFKAMTNPKTETRSTDDGWKVVSAVAPVKIDSANIIVTLTVISGFGKTMSIRSSLNDESYAADIDALFGTMELDKTRKANRNVASVPSSTTIEGSTGKFGLMKYSAPEGWSHQVFSDGVVFKPLDLPQGEHLAIQIMQPLNVEGNIEQALQRSYDEAALMYHGSKMNYAGSGADYQKTDPKISFQGWEYMKANGGIQISSGDRSLEYGLDLFIVKINNRFERVAILKSRTINRDCSMSSYYPDERLQYKNAIDNFLFHLQFTDGPEPLIAQKSIEGGGIKGVWQGISMSAGTPSTSSPAGLQYKVYSPVFMPNGQAYFGPRFPIEGLNEVDTRIPAELHQRDWGTYSFSNGRGVLKMPYGELPLRMEGNKLIIRANNTDHRFFQLSSVDGARFNGIYVMDEAYGKIPSITFTADGRFIDNGALRVLYHEYSDCVNPALKPGSGSYEVKDFTVTFIYNDGRKIKIAFPGTEYDIKNPSPSILRLSYNEDPMKRR